nr:MAG TPA: Trm112p-like protein [Caudoviricetes sp.]
MSEDWGADAVGMKAYCCPSCGDPATYEQPFICSPPL